MCSGLDLIIFRPNPFIQIVRRFFNLSNYKTLSWVGSDYSVITTMVSLPLTATLLAADHPHQKSKRQIKKLIGNK